MTALAAFSGRDAAFLLTDRANFDAEGRLAFRRRKVVALPRLQMAVAINGLALTGWQDRLAQVARGWRVQEEAVDQFPAFARETHAALEASPEWQGEGFHHYFVASWAGAAPKLFMCAGGNAFIDRPYRPFDMLPLGDIMSPSTPGFDLSIAAHFPAFEPVSFARRLAEAQRLQAFDRGGYFVGVAADLTTVTAAGISTRTVATWPDLLGRKIDPTRRWGWRTAVERLID